MRITVVRCCMAALLTVCSSCALAAGWAGNYIQPKCSEEPLSSKGACMGYVGAFDVLEALAFICPGETSNSRKVDAVIKSMRRNISSLHLIPPNLLMTGKAAFPCK
jgi:hypothetical protein